MKKFLNKHQFHLIAVGLLLVTAAAYHGALQGEFISYDDDKYVSDNHSLKADLPFAGIKYAFTTFDLANWHPLTWLSYMVDKGLYGLNPMGFHLTNLLFHLANTVLLLVVLRRMTARPGSPQAGSLWKSAFVAGLFALHPLHVESVAWIAERKDVLSTFFWLTTMWAYVSYAEKPGVSRYALVMALFALGLMSKPMLVTLPLVLLLLDYWPLGRLRFGKTKKQEKGLQALIVEKIPLFALSACSSVVTCMAQNQGMAMSTLTRVPMAHRLSNALVSYVSYLLKTVWPAKLAVFYPLVKPPAWQALGATFILILLSYLVFRAKRPYLAVGWLWFVGTMMPVIGLVQVGAQSMADRYSYVPLIGIFIILAWGIPEVLGKRPIALSAGAGVIVLALAILTQNQVRHWRNDVTLFSHALKVTKNNYVAYSSLGTALARQGKYQPAVDLLTKAIELRSDMPVYYLSLGNAYFALHKYDEAIDAYSRELSVDPNMEDARKNMEITLARQRSSRQPGVQPPSKEAVEHYEKGGVLYDQRNIDAAIQEFRAAIRICPKFAEAHSNLGLALKQQDKTDEAIAEYNKAISLRPDLAEAHNNLAVALYFKGEYAQAWKEVHLCQKYGGSPIPDFLNALSEKMPDPGS
ncbi:MAG TPA: tetratricopeptide repeat protein [Armatimonadota bacterium]|nr:tetratricopeptide repeat protein [Armatimonadota bacterium]